MIPQHTGVALRTGLGCRSNVVAAVDEAISAARCDLISSIRGYHEDFAPVLSQLMASPKVGFGEATAVVMNTGGAGGGPGVGILADVAAVLEMVNLVAALHADLPVDLRSVDSAASWGWATLSVCLADCLNGEALCRINELPASIADGLARELRRVMRQAALAASTGQGGADLVSVCRGELLSAAVVIAGDRAASAHHASTAEPSTGLPPQGA